ncbi:MAG: amino acid permease [Candidatus Zixiibacteriota bacterium]
MAEHLPQPGEEHEIKLTRSLGLLSATMLGVGAMIGAGIFILSGLAAGTAGPGATVSYLLVGFMTLFTALSYCELAAAIPIAGGGYTFVHEAIGGFTAFITGWSMVFGLVVSAALYAIGFAEHFNPLVELALPYELNRAVAAAAIVVLLALLNVKGTKEAGHTQNLFTIGKVVILGVFVVLCFRYVEWDRFEVFAPFGTMGILAATSLIYISFFGFEQISDAAEEVKSPEKNVPRAILLALIIPTVIYVLVVMVSVGIIDYEVLGTAPAPLAIIASKVLGGYGLFFVLVAGVLSTISALNAAILTTSRVTYAIARDGFMPGFLSRVNARFRTPHWAIVATAGLAGIVAVMGEVKAVAHLTNFCLLFALIVVNISVIMLRRRRPELKRPFRLPFGPVIPVLGIISNLLMMLFMDWTTYLLGVGFLGVGGLVYIAYAKGAKRTLERERVIKYLMAKQARKEYKILVPIANPETMKSLVTVAAAIAKKFDGEILLLSVVEVPYYVSLERGVGRAGDYRPLLTLAEKICEREGVTDVKRMIKIAHRLSHGILETAREEQCNFIVMGRVNRPTLGDRLLATVIDAVIDHAPCDVAVVRPGAIELADIDRILVAVSGSANSRLAAELSPAFADRFDAKLKVITVSGAADEFGLPRYAARNVLDEVVCDVECRRGLEREVVYAEDVTEAVMSEIMPGDLVVTGARKGGAWEQLLFKSIPEEIYERVENTVVIIKKFMPVRRGKLEELLLGAAPKD